MPVINNGGNATVSLLSNDYISVQAGSGYARFECPVGTVVAEFTGARTFGPYADQTCKITSVQGAVFYEFVHAQWSASMSTRRRQAASNAFFQRRNSAPFLKSTVASPAPTVTVNVNRATADPTGKCPKAQQMQNLVTPRYGVIQPGANAGFLQVIGSTLQSDITGGSAGFVLTGRYVLIQVKDSVSYNYIRVNGSLLQAGVIDTTGGINPFVFIDFGSYGDWLVEVDFACNGGLREISTENTGSIRKAPVWPTRIVVAGDSQSANAVSDTAAANGDLYACRLWPRLLADMLLANLVQCATPSMGWMTGALALTNPVRRAEFIAAGAASDAGMVLMGTNDAPDWGGAVTYPALYAAVRTLVREWIGSNPSIPLTVFGVLRSANYATNTATEACILQAVSDIGSPMVKGYPLCTGATPLIYGSGRQGTVAGNGTSDWIVGPDGTHLTLLGQPALADYIGDRLVDHWASL